jgi:4-hydroxy-tetrahydrodipicolinate reductase
MPSSPIRLAVAGAQGRMGQAVVKAIEARDGASLQSAFDRPGPSPDDLADVDGVIDFTTPEASVALAKACAMRGGPSLVIGATGFTPAQDAEIATAAQTVAIVRSGNFSLGVNVLLGLVRQVARALPAQTYDIEIAEAHHRRKVDAPSGTALMLGQGARRYHRPAAGRRDRLFGGARRRDRRRAQCAVRRRR